MTSDESVRDHNPSEGFDGGTAVGKRYIDMTDAVELLCTKSGAGTLSIASEVLEVKSAKPLPASD